MTSWRPPGIQEDLTEIPYVAIHFDRHLEAKMPAWRARPWLSPDGICHVGTNHAPLLIPMIERILNLWKGFYAWGSGQPLFLQVALGLGLVLVGIYVLGWTLGILFMIYLRRSEKKQ